MSIDRPESGTKFSSQEFRDWVDSLTDSFNDLASAFESDREPLGDIIALAEGSRGKLTYYGTLQTDYTGGFYNVSISQYFDQTTEIIENNPFRTMGDDPSGLDPQVLVYHAEGKEGASGSGILYRVQYENQDVEDVEDAEEFPASIPVYIFVPIGVDVFDFEDDAWIDVSVDSANAIVNVSHIGPSVTDATVTLKAVSGNTVVTAGTLDFDEKGHYNEGDKDILITIGTLTGNAVQGDQAIDPPTGTLQGVAGTWIDVYQDTVSNVFRVHHTSGTATADPANAITVTGDAGSEDVDVDKHGHVLGPSTLGLYGDAWISTSVSDAGGPSVDFTHEDANTTVDEVIIQAVVNGSNSALGSITFDAKGHYNTGNVTINSISIENGDLIEVSASNGTITIDHEDPTSGIGSEDVVLRSGGYVSVTQYDNGHVKYGTPVAKSETTTNQIVNSVTAYTYDAGGNLLKVEYAPITLTVKKDTNSGYVTDVTFSTGTGASFDIDTEECTS